MVASESLRVHLHVSRLSDIETVQPASKNQSFNLSCFHSVLDSFSVGNNGKQ